MGTVASAHPLALLLPSRVEARVGLKGNLTSPKMLPWAGGPSSSFPVTDLLGL